LVGAGLAAPALLWLTPLANAAVWARQDSAHPGQHVWLLDSASDLRPASPPSISAAEADELLAMQNERTDAQREVIARWGGRPAPLPWTDLTLDLITAAKPSPPRAGRALALVHVAISDALAAVRDAKAASQRPAPVSSVPGLTSLATDGDWSFPSTHAAVAGAAGAVLGYLFPTEAGRLTAAAEEAAASRLWAGANTRGDVEAGLAIGREVGRLATAWGRGDGSDAEWDGVLPTGDGTWRPTPPKNIPVPLDPLAGSWATWVLPSGDALRPPSPPAWGSPGWQAELLAVQEAVAQRTAAQGEAAEFWAGGPGTVTPAGLWIEIARGLIERDGLDDALAAQTLAWLSVAMADGFVCCWDAKFTYWTARPITADPTLAVLFATPPFPSYTSGHSTISAAAATVLGHVFPADADDLAAMAVEAKNSRLWAGIHYSIDNDMGALGGGMVGRLVVARMTASAAEGEPS
jgi:membrane-associated phospholipid phosphatase